MRVDAHIAVRCPDSGDRDGGTEVSERLDRLPIPRDSQAKRPDTVGDEEHHSRLVETVQHVHPELEPGVLETADTTDVQLREGQRSLGVEVLVECYSP